MRHHMSQAIHNTKVRPDERAVKGLGYSGERGQAQPKFHAQGIA